MNIEKSLSEALNFMREGEVGQAEFLLNTILKAFPKNSDALTQKGIILIHKRKFKKGIDLIKSSLLIKLNQPEAFLHMGIAFYQENKFDEAIKCFDDAIKFKSDYSEAFYTKALCYENKILKDEAITNFELAILYDPNYIDPIITLGALYNELHQFDKALNLFKKAEILKPNNKAYLCMIAQINLAMDNLNEAIKYSTDLVKLYPMDTILLEDRAFIYMKDKNFDDALIDLNKAIQLNPKHTSLFYFRSLVLESLGLHFDAEIDCKKALEFDSENPHILAQLGLINTSLERFDKAFSFYEKAINLNPKDAIVITNKARLFTRLENYDLAKIEYMKLLDMHDNIFAMSNASLYFLHHRNYSIGWNAYSARLSLSGSKLLLEFVNEVSKQCSQWEGQLNCESLLLICEQGVGDHIIYLSMLKELSKKIKKITVMLNPKLIALFERSFENIHFIPSKTDKYEMPPNISSFEYFVLFGDLGKFLRNSIESFQNQPNFYLIADLKKTNRFRSKFKTTKLVCGLSWASQLGNVGRLHKDNARVKSIFLSDLMPIFNQTKLTYINLQYGDVKNEIMHFKDSFGIEILNSDNDNYDDIDGLASLIQSCDFVITTSNVTAHLAGALGKKTFVLVNPEQLWYWHDENVSSWYPSVNIFQKKLSEDWRPAIERMSFSVLNYLKGIENG